MSKRDAALDVNEFVLETSIARRDFLRLGGSVALATSVMPRLAATPAYRVGVGRSASPYVATQRAISASGEWPALGVAGKVVVIKPNLVSATTADTGIVTDPEVTRAVVDLALTSGAVAVLIVEANSTPGQAANFVPCGYEFFATYDPAGRVRLVDLAALPSSLVSFSRGWIYGAIYVAPLILRRDFVFINIAKLKTHAESVVSLATKNLVGLPTVTPYITIPAVARFGLHDRGLHQAIIDLNQLRPTDFAVIDGIVGMEGRGPIQGTPVRMDLVLAGRNAVAVDRVGLTAMQVSQTAVRYLNYASAFGLGPTTMSQITVAGDALNARAFALSQNPPNLDPPVITPAAFTPGTGQTTALRVNYYTPCLRTLEIVRLYDDQPTRMDLVRTLLPPSWRDTGAETAVWDGRAADGSLAPPGRYAAHVRAEDLTAGTRHADAVSWVRVMG